MSKKIRFPLKMADDTQARTLDELREHFDLESILVHYKSGKLLTWLEDRYLEGEAEAVRALDETAPDFQRKLCEVFQVEYAGDDADMEAIQLRQERLAKLRTITDEPEFIDHVDQIAFDQEELADLLDEEQRSIYLCGEKFAVPASRKGIAYIGIGNPAVHISGKVPEDPEDLEIVFQNCAVDNLPQAAATTETPDTCPDYGGLDKKVRELFFDSSRICWKCNLFAEDYLILTLRLPHRLRRNCTPNEFGQEGTYYLNLNTLKLEPIALPSDMPLVDYTKPSVNELIYNPPGSPKVKAYDIITGKSRLVTNNGGSRRLFATPDLILADNGSEKVKVFVKKSDKEISLPLLECGNPRPLNGEVYYVNPLSSGELCGERDLERYDPISGKTSVIGRVPHDFEPYKFCGNYIYGKTNQIVSEFELVALNIVTGEIKNFGTFKETGVRGDSVSNCRGFAVIFDQDYDSPLTIYAINLRTSEMCEIACFDNTEEDVSIIGVIGSSLYYMAEDDEYEEVEPEEYEDDEESEEDYDIPRCLYKINLESPNEIIRVK